MRGQIALALDNLEAVLKGAGMDPEPRHQAWRLCDRRGRRVEELRSDGHALWPRPERPADDIAGCNPPRHTRFAV